MSEPRVIEIAMKGSGELTLGLIDRKGKVLLKKRLITAGADAIEAKSRVPLALQTREGEVPVVPVLMHQSTLKQQITFAGKEPATFTKEQCRKLRFSREVIERSAKVAAKQVRQQGLLLASLTRAMPASDSQIIP